MTQNVQVRVAVLTVYRDQVWVLANSNGELFTEVWNGHQNLLTVVASAVYKLDLDVDAEQFQQLRAHDIGAGLEISYAVAVPWQTVDTARANDPDLTPTRVSDLSGRDFRTAILAVEWMRAAYATEPDPAGLLYEPFTLLELRTLHEAVAGQKQASADTFRRGVIGALEPTGDTRNGVPGKPAQTFTRGN